MTKDINLIRECHFIQLCKFSNSCEKLKYYGDRPTSLATLYIQFLKSISNSLSPLFFIMILENHIVLFV